MSDDLLKPMHGTVPGDWWTIAAAFQNLAAYLAKDKNIAQPFGGPGRDGYTVALYGTDRTRLGEITFSGRNGQTDITIIPASMASMEYWTYTFERLQIFARAAHDLRRENQPTADEVIQRYYKSRAAGGRKTLRQIVEETTYSYDYIRKAKRAYDAAGKYGSKKEPAGS